MFKKDVDANDYLFTTVSLFLAMTEEPFYALLLLPIDVNYMIEVVQAIIRKQKE